MNNDAEGQQQQINMDTFGPDAELEEEDKSMVGGGGEDIEVKSEKGKKAPRKAKSRAKEPVWTGNERRYFIEEIAKVVNGRKLFSSVVAMMTVPLAFLSVLRHLLRILFLL